MDLYAYFIWRTRRFFARDNGKKKSSGNAQAHLPDSGSITWNIYQILSWNDGLNLWKVLVRSVVFYNITVCYEWIIITVGFSHSQRPSYRKIGIFSHQFVLYALCQCLVFIYQIYLSQAKYMDVLMGLDGLLTHQSGTSLIITMLIIDHK